MVGVLVGLTACSSPTGPTPVPPPATSRIVFGTIRWTEVRPNGKASSPASPAGLSAGTVEVTAETVPESGQIALWLFKLPKFGSAEYATELQKFVFCVSRAEISGACEGAVASETSFTTNKVLRVKLTEDDVRNEISYQTVMWHRGQEMVASAVGEYAYIPPQR